MQSGTSPPTGNLSAPADPCVRPHKIVHVAAHQAHDGEGHADKQRVEGLIVHVHLLVCAASQNGTTDSHRGRGLRSEPVKAPKRRATLEVPAMTCCTRSLGLDVSWPSRTVIPLSLSTPRGQGDFRLRPASGSELGNSGGASSVLPILALTPSHSPSSAHPACSGSSSDPVDHRALVSRP